MVLERKYIGVILAICSSLLIGISFVITKKGLLNASTKEHGRASDTHRYLKNPVWWIGLAVMVTGEVMNFIGYTFAPAILITPLGALSVIVGAVLGSICLKERMGPIGTIGCSLSVIGAVIIIFHAPEDPEVSSVQELVSYMLKPGFLTYAITVILVVVGMIWKVVPRWGKTTPIVYLSICSLVGSLSVMAVKAFGIAVRLTIAGNNQFNQPSPYIFGALCIMFIIVQVNYFNKALDLFSTNVVNPIYYVCFTTATIIASAIMFQGWHTSSYTNTVSLICGFLIIFSGVYLLDMVAPMSNLTSTSLLELPFSSSSCRVNSSIAVNEKRNYWTDEEDFTDTEENDYPNAIRKRPRASSV